MSVCSHNSNRNWLPSPQLSHDDIDQFRRPGDDLPGFTTGEDRHHLLTGESPLDRSGLVDGGRHLSAVAHFAGDLHDHGHIVIKQLRRIGSRPCFELDVVPSAQLPEFCTQVGGCRRHDEQ